MSVDWVDRGTVDRRAPEGLRHLRHARRARAGGVVHPHLIVVHVRGASEARGDCLSAVTNAGKEVKGTRRGTWELRRGAQSIAANVDE